MLLRRSFYDVCMHMHVQPRSSWEWPGVLLSDVQSKMASSAQQVSGQTRVTCGIHAAARFRGPTCHVNPRGRVCALFSKRAPGEGAGSAQPAGSL